jgi:hypothetical protein
MHLFCSLVCVRPSYVLCFRSSQEPNTNPPLHVQSPLPPQVCHCIPRALLCTAEELPEVASQEVRSAYIRVS